MGMGCSYPRASRGEPSFIPQVAGAVPGALGSDSTELRACPPGLSLPRGPVLPRGRWVGEWVALGRCQGIRLAPCAGPGSVPARARAVSLPGINWRAAGREHLWGAEHSFLCGRQKLILNILLIFHNEITARLLGFGFQFISSSL